MKISKIKNVNAIILGALLFLLTLKGGEVIEIGEGFEIIIALPSWLLLIKKYTYQIVALLIGATVVLSYKNGGYVKYSMPLIGYLFVMSYYFTASLFWGSGQIENLAAIAIILLITQARLKTLSLSSGGCGYQEWLYALNVFAISFIILNTVLYFLGYGYPELNISNTRYFGACYHPNALGAMAAISAGILISQAPRLEITSRLKIIYLVILLCAIFLTVISGSRAGLLMLSIATLVLIRSFKSFVYICVVIFIFTTIAMTLGDSDGDIYLALERMINAPTGNRSEVWQLLVDDFQENFLMGVGDRTGVSGSVYLTAFSGTGFIGGLIFTVVMLLTGKRAVDNIKNHGLRRTGSASLVTSVVVLQVLVGSLFEAGIFDRLSPISLITLIGVTVINMKGVRLQGRRLKGVNSLGKI